VLSISVRKLQFFFLLERFNTFKLGQFEIKFWISKPQVSSKEISKTLIFQKSKPLRFNSSKLKSLIFERVFKPKDSIELPYFVNKKSLNLPDKYNFFSFFVDCK